MAVADANYAVPVGEDLTLDTALLPNLNMIAAVLSDFSYPDGMSTTDFLKVQKNSEFKKKKLKIMKIRIYFNVFAQLCSQI